MTREEIIRELEERTVGEDCRWIAIRCDVVREIVRMLREQEPRVMTLEELRIDADESVVCWVEFASKSAVNVTAPHRGMAHICLPFLGTETITFVVERNYGEKWRCWTSRPDEQVRRDTPWDVSLEERKKWELDDEIASGIGQTFSPD